MENYNDDQCNLVSLLYVKMPVVVLLTIAFALSSPISTQWERQLTYWYYYEKKKKKMYTHSRFMSMYGETATLQYCKVISFQLK